MQIDRQSLGWPPVIPGNHTLHIGKRFLYYEGLAHAVLEAEKSHGVLCGNWKPRNADSGVVTRGLTV